MIKRFLVFGGKHYDYRLGWYGFKGSFDTIAEAQEQAAKYDDDDHGAHIVDMETETIIARFGQDEEW